MISKVEEFDKFTFVTISDIGANHKALLMPNQDAADFCCDNGDFVLVVSDGVGSCKKAEMGSKYVVNACVEIFKKLQNGHIDFENDTIAEELIFIWTNSIENDIIDDYCATVKTVFKIGNIIKIVSIGDGFVAVSSDGINLITPMEDASFTNETKCLGKHIKISDFWIADFQIDTRKSYAIMCCTDGVANAILDGKELELVEDIEKNIISNELKNELEELIKDISEYSFDDKTLGVVKYEW